MDFLDFLKIKRVKTQEINQLTCCIDFCLVSRFCLCQHGCSIDFRPVGACNQVCSLQENGSSVLPGHHRPPFTCRQSCINSCTNVRGVSVVEVADHMAVVMRRRHGTLVVRPNLIGSDVHRYIPLGPVVHIPVGIEERLSLLGMRCIRQDWFVDGFRNTEMTV